MHEMFASQVLQGLENLEAIQVQMMSAVMEGKIWPKEEMLRLFTYTQLPLKRDSMESKWF